MLRNILFSILIITIISNLIKILSECYNLKLVKSKKFEHFRTCSPGQGPNGLSGYQCTLGCGGGTGDMARYPYTSKEQAGDVCRARGFRGLCTKQEVVDAGRSERLNQCCNGWTLDGENKKCGNGACGWYQYEERPGCGHGWNNWNRTAGAGAHCCGESPAATDLRRTKKSMLITQTKLAKAEALLHKFDGAKEEIDNMRNEMRARQNKCNERINADAMKCQKEQQTAAEAATANFNQKYAIQGEQYEKSKDELRADHATAIANQTEKHQQELAARSEKAQIVIDAAEQAINSDLDLIKSQEAQLTEWTKMTNKNAPAVWMAAITNDPGANESPRPPTNSEGVEVISDKAFPQGGLLITNRINDKRVQKNKQAQWNTVYKKFKNMGQTVSNDENEKDGSLNENVYKEDTEGEWEN